MLYRYIHIDAPWSLNYVVYRHFDDLKCDVHKLAETHRVATFVCKTEAEDYCAYRNEMVERYGSDDVALIKHPVGEARDADPVNALWNKAVAGSVDGTYPKVIARFAKLVAAAECEAAKAEIHETLLKPSMHIDDRTCYKKATAVLERRLERLQGRVAGCASNNEG